MCEDSGQGWGEGVKVKPNMAKALRIALPTPNNKRALYWA